MFPSLLAHSSVRTTHEGGREFGITRPGKMSRINGFAISQNGAKRCHVVILRAAPNQSITDAREEYEDAIEYSNSSVPNRLSVGKCPPCKTPKLRPIKIEYFFQLYIAPYSA